MSFFLLCVCLLGPCAASYAGGAAADAAVIDTQALAPPAVAAPFQPPYEPEALARTLRGFSYAIGSDGQNIGPVLRDMILQGREQLSLARALALAGQSYEAALRTALPLSSFQDLHAVEDMIETWYPSWLANHPQVVESFIGRAISYLVRYRLLENSTLSEERKKDVLNHVMDWCHADEDRPHPYWVKTGPQVMVEFKLANGPNVRIVTHAMHHARSRPSAKQYVNALNLPLKIDPKENLAFFSVLLEFQACTTAAETFQTFEHELWEVGLRALGYSVDEAHRLAYVYVDEGKPFQFLIDHPRAPTPGPTWGPGASAARRYA